MLRSLLQMPCNGRLNRVLGLSTPSAEGFQLWDCCTNQFCDTFLQHLVVTHCGERIFFSFLIVTWECLKPVGSVINKVSKVHRDFPANPGVLLDTLVIRNHIKLISFGPNQLILFVMGIFLVNSNPTDIFCFMLSVAIS